jgi:hypothetical protein
VTNSRGSAEDLPNQLQQLVLTRLAELGEPGRPMSLRAAAERARGLTTHHTLTAIANGEHSGRISDRTAEGIAAALDVPVTRVYDAAGAPRPHGRWHWPDKFDRVRPEDRVLIEDLAAALLKAEERGYERARRESR